MKHSRIISQSSARYDGNIGDDTDAPHPRMKLPYIDMKYLRFPTILISKTCHQSKFIYLDNNENLFNVIFK